MATVNMHATDTSHSWSNVEVPFVVPLHMPLAALAEALDALGWRTIDLEELTGRNIAIALQAKAKREGKEYIGPIATYSGKDEVLSDQLAIFGSLNAAGHTISWKQVAALSRRDYTIVSAPAELEQVLTGEAPATEDPQKPSTDSAPAVDVASTESGAAAPQHGQK